LLDGCPREGAFECIRQEVTHFIGTAEQRDDISLVVIPCNGALMEASLQERQAPPEPNVPDPWNWSLRLEGASLRRVDPVPLVMHHLKSFGVPARHLQQVYVVVIELFNNALDHGVLCLDSSLKKDAEGFVTYYSLREQKLASLREGFIEIRLDYRPGEQECVLAISVEDSGSGFCHGQCSNCSVVADLRGENAELANPAPEPFLATSGRGLRLIRSLCRNVRYQGAGNHVELEYLL
jgi:anti-sigma regulatory factor (Ser/Thr protein kinase)